ncbi:MAG: hypothetical protein LBI61_01665 [Puniceicoccales bacterium]|nr:hypothetical protein [Puniceicoccales bacterium]
MSKVNGTEEKKEVESKEAAKKKGFFSMFGGGKTDAAAAANAAPKPPTTEDDVRKFAKTNKLTEIYKQAKKDHPNIKPDTMQSLLEAKLAGNEAKKQKEVARNEARREIFAIAKVLESESLESMEAELKVYQNEGKIGKNLSLQQAFAKDRAVTELKTLATSDPAAAKAKLESYQKDDLLSSVLSMDDIKEMSTSADNGKPTPGWCRRFGAAAVGCVKSTCGFIARNPKTIIAAVAVAVPALSTAGLITSVAASAVASIVLVADAGITQIRGAMAQDRAYNSGDNATAVNQANSMQNAALQNAQFQQTQALARDQMAQQANQFQQQQDNTAQQSELNRRNKLDAAERGRSQVSNNYTTNTTNNDSRVTNNTTNSNTTNNVDNRKLSSLFGGIGNEAQNTLNANAETNVSANASLSAVGFGVAGAGGYANAGDIGSNNKVASDNTAQLASNNKDNLSHNLETGSENSANASLFGNGGSSGGAQSGNQRRGFFSRWLGRR